MPPVGTPSINPQIPQYRPNNIAAYLRPKRRRDLRPVLYVRTQHLESTRICLGVHRVVDGRRYGLISHRNRMGFHTET